MLTLLTILLSIFELNFFAFSLLSLTNNPLEFSCTAKGTANAMYSGYVSSLVENARKLYPNKEPQPVICLESDAW